MKLIGSTSSPYVRKVRVVMAEKKLDYEFITEDVWSADTTITQSNPLGKVPCLIMEAGEALFDSRVIVEYLDTLSPVGKLIPSTGRERAEVKTWEALADGVMDASILARLEAMWPGRSAEQRIAIERGELDGIGPRTDELRRRERLLEEVAPSEDPPLHDGLPQARALGPWGVTVVVMHGSRLVEAKPDIEELRDQGGW